jgi:hypothetical protein
MAARPQDLKPSPRTAPQFAERAVSLVQQKFGFSLPYNPPSLIVVDALVDKIKETGASEQQASGLLFGLGCYVGEVFVRNAGASWRATAEMGMAHVCGFPVVLALRSGEGCNPVGKVFGRFREGAAHSVADLFESLGGPPVSVPASPKAPADRPPKAS